MPKKSDANQPQIVADLRAVGVSVQDLHAVGKGCPDILCGYRGKNYLLEIKGRSGKLTEDQNTWHIKWAGRVDVVRTTEEAYRAVGVLETWGF
jgi:hypothetical protein